MVECMESTRIKVRFNCRSSGTYSLEERLARSRRRIRSMNGICLRRREPEMMPPRLIGVGSARWIREGGTG